MRLVIADDQPSARNGLDALFAHLSQFQVIATVENGEQAVELARTQNPDVVVMDIEMPLMNGLEATRRIRELNLPIHIVALSGYAELETQALEVGADAFVVKSEPPDHFLRVLEQWLAETPERSLSMPYGPVQYFVIAFPKNQFRGEIIPALQQIVSAGLVRLVDIAFAEKDADGNLLTLEINDLDDEEFNGFTEIVTRVEGLLSNADILELAAEIPPNHSAALLVLEHTWGIALADAIRNANGQLIREGYVPRKIVAEVMPTRTAETQ